MQLIVVSTILLLAAVKTLEVQGRIIDSNAAVHKEFPYTAGLEIIKSDANFYYGSGVILSESWILTIARPLEEAIAVGVHVCAIDVRDVQKEDQQRVINVPKVGIIRHENYTHVPLKNDIALLKLPLTIQFSEYAQPAKVPMNATKYIPCNCEMAAVAGWGSTDRRAHMNSNESLHYVVQPLIPNDKCQQFTKKTINDSLICLDTRNGTTACYGDEGAPLILKGSNILLGLFTYGSGAECEPKELGIFYRIEAYCDWITKQSGIKTVE